MKTSGDPGERGSGAGAKRTCVRNAVKWVGKYVSVLVRQQLLYRLALSGMQLKQLAF